MPAKIFPISRVLAAAILAEQELAAIGVTAAVIHLPAILALPAAPAVRVAVAVTDAAIT
jgi:hypothetical protein